MKEDSTPPPIPPSARIVHRPRRPIEHPDVPPPSATTQEITPDQIITDSEESGIRLVLPPDPPAYRRQLRTAPPIDEPDES